MNDLRKAVIQAIDALENAADILREAIGEHDMAEYKRLVDKLAEEAQEMGLYK